MVIPAIVLAVVLAYLLGSVPTGLLVGRRLTGGDIRQHGSGKTGATNVLRTFGWRPAALVAAVDIGKGFAAVLAARAVARAFDVEAGAVPYVESLAGFAAIAGHNFPVFAGFRGGRGVATGFGTLIAINPPISLSIILIGLTLMVGSDMVSLGSVVGAALAVPFVWLWGDRGYLPYVAVSAALVIVQHRDNIARILAGTERRLGVRAKLIDRLHQP